jgi:hypothetical protein
VWNLFFVTRLPPRIVKWLGDFWTSCVYALHMKTYVHFSVLHTEDGLSNGHSSERYTFLY